jgi:hypothetical protein
VSKQARIPEGIVAVPLRVVDVGPDDDVVQYPNIFL